MASPTQRTLAYCRERNYIAQVTEHWQAFSRRRVDLYGYIDVLAITPAWPLLGPGKLLAIQTTSGSNTAARVTKIKTECREAALAWLRAGGLISVHGWRKIKLKRGGKAMVWALKEQEITEADLD